MAIVFLCQLVDWIWKDFVIDYDISLSGVRMTKKEIIALFAFVLLFYGSLRAITGTEYVKIPQGERWEFCSGRTFTDCKELTGSDEGTREHRY